MKYLVKNKESGQYQEIPDILRFDKNTLKTHILFFADEISEDQFDEQIKVIQRNELMKEIEEKQKKLAELGVNTSVSSTPVHLAPTAILMPPPVGNTPAPVKQGPINPQTRKPYSKNEVDMMFNRLQEEVNRSEGEGIFEHVMWIENEGDHFVACVNKMNPQFPRQMHGIPVVQKIDPLVDGFGQR